MLYAVLFATLVYVNSGQTITLPACTMDSECSSLDNTYGGSLGFIGITASETFVCSSRLRTCTLTCTDANTCGKINSSPWVAQITDSQCLNEGDGVMKCTSDEDRSCSSGLSSECAGKAIIGSLYPRCDPDTLTCVEQTDSPTNAPITARPTPDPTTAAPNATPNPTDSPVTPNPTDAPTTTEQGIRDCMDACPTTGNDVAMRCKADINYDLSAFGGSNFELTIPCQDVENECQAECLVSKTIVYYTKDYNTNTQNMITGSLPSDPVAEFCKAGSCSDEPTTTGDTDTYEQCMIDCALQDRDPMYCEGSDTVPVYNVEIEIPCTDVRNKCAAQCFVDQQKEEIAASKNIDVSLVEIGISNLYPKDQYPDGLVSAFCFEGTCDGTTSMPDGDFTTTDERECDNDPYYDANCPDEDPEDGCNVQFNVTLDLCILNRKFTRNKIFRYAKLAYIYAMEEVADYTDCIEADLKITRFLPGYKDNNAMMRGKRRPRRRRTDDDDESTCGGDNDPDNVCCEDLEDICGANRNSKKFTLDIDTQFTCGSCEKMKSVVTTIKTLLEQFDAAFVLECLDLSQTGLDVGLDGDDLCLTGFGHVAMEVTDASLAYINENGVTEVEVGTGDANGIKYGFALIFAFIMAAFY